MSKDTIRFLVAAVITVLVVIVCWSLYHENIKKNDYQTWQVCQNAFGKVTIVDNPGYYTSFFPTVTTYNQVNEAFFSAHPKEGGQEDDSISVTFNDGGTSKISTFVRYNLPVEEKQRLALHRAFSGNPENIKATIRATMINVVKATAPIMTSTENQSARRAEFTDLIQQQLQNGLYSYKMEVEENKNATATDGKPVKVYRSEIVRDENKKPIISQASPLDEYGIKIIQFAVTGIDYDEQTLAQFSAKKALLQKAENFKAQKDAADQEALSIKAAGLKDAADAEAKANVLATTQRINAELTVTIAKQDKLKAETDAAKKVAVAEQSKLEAEVLANQQKVVAETMAAQKVAVAEQAKKEAEVLAQNQKQVAEIAAQQSVEVAKLALEAAKNQAQAKVTLAEATQKEIALAGKITELQQAQLTITKEQAIGVAEALSKISVPSTVINGGNGGPAGADNNSQLTQLLLLKSMGVLKDATVEKK